MASDHIAQWISGKIACPLCTEGKKARRHHAGHFGRPPGPGAKRLLMARFIKDKMATPLEDETAKQALAGAWSGTYPAMCEYLTQTAWAGGEPRQTMTLLLFVEDGVWKACLTDRDTEPRKVAFVSAKTPEALLGAVEARLATGSIEWRASYGGRGKRK